MRLSVRNLCSDWQQVRRTPRDPGRHGLRLRRRHWSPEVFGFPAEDGRSASTRSSIEREPSRRSSQEFLQIAFMARLPIRSSSSTGPLKQARGSAVLYECGSHLECLKDQAWILPPDTTHFCPC
ncbi:hypothetical protein Q5P01_002617 [Channa striata]|uniref:Uncharacterized protein n=1 Tax=Channa striata TaxID=64152 RepID=A0AA88NRQ1_CHASR|nr:hypothetical protein Q5P01_002617 [Channa striata]